MEFTVEFKWEDISLYLPIQSDPLKFSYIYICVVKKIVINEPNSEKITIIGEHKENMTDQDVTCVFIDINFRTRLHKFPGGFGKIFEYLKYFWIRNSLIKTLSKQDFFYLEHLQGLWLEKSFIVSLPGDLFTNVQGLRYLSFNENKLKYIGRDLLKPLKNLERADFFENTTIDFAMSETKDLSDLNNEIATKCITPSHSIEEELQGQVKLLEDKVKQLENEKAKMIKILKTLLE